jgi:nucleotide-binding universal stress UspA family protein
MDAKLLICTNGYEATWQAIEYGAWVAQALGAPTVLLGIAEEHDAVAAGQQPGVDAMLQRAEGLFAQKGLRYEVDREKGRAELTIPLAARQSDFLTVLGPLGRPRLRRFLTGRSIRGFLEDIPTAVLYVPRSCLPLRKMLICVGGLGFEITAEHLAVRLGVAAGAQATLLHVVPPVDLDYPTARAEKEHWRDLDRTDTLSGKNLRRALETAKAAGLEASLRMRQGDVVEELLEEMKTGGYDLVCMGSPHGGHTLRRLYETNVTDEIAEHATCPVLTARYVPEADPQQPTHAPS